MQLYFAGGTFSGDVRTTVLPDPLIKKANGRRGRSAHLLGTPSLCETIRRPCCYSTGELFAGQSPSHASNGQLRPPGPWAAPGSSNRKLNSERVELGLLF